MPKTLYRPITLDVAEKIRQIIFLKKDEPTPFKSTVKVKHIFYSVRDDIFRAYRKQINEIRKRS